MRTRELISYLEQRLSTLNTEKNQLEETYKWQQYKFKKRARKTYVKLHEVYGAIDEINQSLTMAKIPSKS